MEWLQLLRNFKMLLLLAIVAVIGGCLWKSIPNDPAAHLEKGKTSHTEAAYEKTIADTMKAIELDPDNVEAHFKRGLAYLSNRGCKKTIVDFNRVIELNPHDADALEGQLGTAVKYSILTSSSSGWASIIFLQSRSKESQ
jgi:tetratricopeptide (TPR) repeat protein